MTVSTIPETLRRIADEIERNNIDLSRCSFIVHGAKKENFGSLVSVFNLHINEPGNSPLAEGPFGSIKISVFGYPGEVFVKRTEMREVEVYNLVLGQ